jgi:SAM-dependent methyltransferase
LELAKALFIFNYNLIIESLKEVLERKKTTRIWASIYAGCWVIRNLKYIWKNRLRYLSMAKVSQETLLSKFIRIRIPTRIYLVPPPIKLLPQYILNETRKYLETLRTHAKFEVVHKRTNGLKEGYDEFSRSKYTVKDDWIVEDKISSPRRWLSTFAEKEKGQCLAVGCGVVDLKILKHNNPNVLGIDISKVALKRAAESGQTVLADATHLPFLSSSFDFVCVFDVLEHVPQKTELLNEVTRTLKDGGRLYLSVPIRADNTPGDMRQPYDQPPTLSVLLGLLRRNGLRLSIIRPFWGPLNSIPYPTYMSFSFIFSLFPYLLMGATQISLIAVKNIEPAVYLIDFLNRKWSQTASSK